MKGRPKKYQNSVIVSVRLDCAVLQRAKAKASAQRRSLSDVVNALLQNWCLAPVEFLHANDAPLEQLRRREEAILKALEGGKL